MNVSLDPSTGDHWTPMPGGSIGSVQRSVGSGGHSGEGYGNHSPSAMTTSIESMIKMESDGRAKLIEEEVDRRALLDSRRFEDISS